MAGEKNSGIALILSFFLPGLGQVYVGKISKGALLISSGVLSAAFAEVLFDIRYAPTLNWIAIVLYVLFFIIWIYGMYDAYESAEATHKSPLELLKSRYTNGEISKKQYDEMEKMLGKLYEEPTEADKEKKRTAKVEALETLLSNYVRGRISKEQYLEAKKKLEV